jgi:hypothetical protein
MSSTGASQDGDTCGLFRLQRVTFIEQVWVVCKLRAATGNSWPTHSEAASQWKGSMSYHSVQGNLPISLIRLDQWARS